MKTLDKSLRITTILDIVRDGLHELAWVDDKQMSMSIRVVGSLISADITTSAEVITFSGILGSDLQVYNKVLATKARES